MPQGTCVCVRPGRRQKMTPDLYLSAFKSRVLWLNTTTEQFACCKAPLLNRWFSAPCQVILPWKRWLQCYRRFIFSVFSHFYSWLLNESIFWYFNKVFEFCVCTVESFLIGEWIFSRWMFINFISVVSCTVISLWHAVIMRYHLYLQHHLISFLCLQYSNSSCSCKQMCICVVVCICVPTCPEIFVIVSYATKQRAPVYGVHLQFIK